MGTNSNRGDPAERLNVGIVHLVNCIADLLNEHEREEHGGARCDAERGNTIAYVIHRMGYNEETLDVVSERTRFYREEHRRLHREKGH